MKRFALGLAPFAVAAALAAAYTASLPAEPEAMVIQVAPAPEPEPGLPVDVTVFPIMFVHGQFRMNVSLLTLPIPDQAFAALREVLRVDEATNTFPVRVWRVREGEPELVQTLRVPAIPTRLEQFAVSSEFQKGDVLAVEYVPGLFVQDGWPIASLIDNASGDPTTIPGVRSQINLPVTPIAKRRRAVRR